MKAKSKKPIGYSIWLKLILTILIFIPSYSQVSYDPAKTPDVIAAVLSNPIITSLTWVLPISKLLLLFVAIVPIISNKTSAKIVLGYYAFILLIVSVFQNIAHTTKYGFVWLIGNTVVQLVVVSFCIYDVIKNKTKINGVLNKNRLWLIPLMLLAFLMPYGVNEVGNVYPDFPLHVFYNEAGVTYCMITPVIIGLLLLYSKGVGKPTLSVISYVGFIFGMLNMITWFITNTANWWMGVLHLPLLIIAFYGLLISRKERTDSMVQF